MIISPHLFYPLLILFIRYFRCCFLFTFTVVCRYLSFQLWCLQCFNVLSYYSLYFVEYFFSFSQYSTDTLRQVIQILLDSSLLLFVITPFMFSTAVSLVFHHSFFFRLVPCRVPPFPASSKLLNFTVVCHGSSNVCFELWYL